MIFCAQTIAKLLNKFIQVACLKILSTSSSSTHTHCLINFLKNASEDLSEVDAYSIEPRVICNRNLRDFVITIQGFRLKFGRRIVLSFPQIATVDFRRLKHSPVKGVSTRSANSTVFYPPCKQFSKLFFRSLAASRASRERRAV